MADTINLRIRLGDVPNPFTPRDITANVLTHLANKLREGETLKNGGGDITVSPPAVVIDPAAPLPSKVVGSWALTITDPDEQ